MRAFSSEVGTGSHRENATKPKIESASRSDRTGRHSNLTIVKIGGSLLSSPDVEAWLATILDWGAPVVIVPGGGPFADQVRETQRKIGFDDRTAHRMALLAMEQVAVLLACRAPQAVLAASRAELEAALGRDAVSIWLPSALVLEAREVPESWDMTSDSLAAWLARVLGASRLLLVKSEDVKGPATARALADAGIVDPLFPRFAKESAAAVFVAGPASLAGARDLLRRGGMPGVRVTVSHWKHSVLSSDQV